jgi:hypothetical protein
MDASHYISIRGAARRVGVADRTIRLAIGRGELDVEHDADGRPMLRVADVESWSQIERTGPGRPRKIATNAA